MGMLDGKAAIITGSGRGIGSATARLLGEQGASVVVSDLDPVPAEETAGAIRNAALGIKRERVKRYGRRTESNTIGSSGSTISSFTSS